MPKCPLCVIAGPTASGKTAFSIELAKQLNGEIISADSMQIYKGMDIATAKPTFQERAQVPHHLIDFLDISEPYSVARYVEDARACIKEIRSRGKLPFLVGGTGLYINAVIDHLSFPEIEQSPLLRAQLQQQAKEQGGAALLEQLRSFDPETASRLHENNLGRIIRAIEVYRLTGIPMWEHQKRSRQEPSPYELCYLGLNFQNRAHLYERINLRVDQMLKQGLVEECQTAMEKGLSGTAVQAIGYKELFPYLSGQMPLSQCVDRLKQATRQYAKRQLTWFRRDPRIFWILLDEMGGNEPIATALSQICLCGLLGDSDEKGIFSNQ